MDSLGLDTVCEEGLVPRSLDEEFVFAGTDTRVLTCEKPAQFIDIAAILSECGLLARSIRIPQVGEVLLEYDGQCVSLLVNTGPHAFHRILWRSASLLPWGM